MNRICPGCKRSRAETLFGSPEDPCAYCMANHVEEDNDDVPAHDPDTRPTKARTAPLPSSSSMAAKELAARALARKHLLPFVERFNPKYDAGWVHKDICRRLEKFSQDVAEKRSPRLMLFMPPRHGKSTLASVAFPAFHLGNHPDHEIISCSYSGSLAMKFSRKVRSILREAQYGTLFPGCELDPDSQSAEEWLTTQGGGYVAAGVGGGITGKGAHVMVIDDPVKNRDDAESAIVQESTRDWYTSTAYTRLAPGGGILIILTRWNDNDLAGWLLSEMKEGGEQWEIVNYPAIAEQDEEYRDAGEALHPERYPLDALMRIQRAVGPRDWSALFQQNPTPATGDYFTDKMMKYYNYAELDLKSLRYYQAWDLAIGKNDRNDFTVGITVGIDRLDNIYVVDLVRGKFSGMQIVEKILDSYELWKPSMVGIEKGHIEQAIGPFLEKRVRERKLYEAFFQDLKTGRRDKEARARAIQGRLQQGKVLFPKGSSFTADLVAEMLRFPNGVHDDQVDALAWIGLMMAEFSTIGLPGKEKKASWRDQLDNIQGAKKRHRSAMSA